MTSRYKQRQLKEQRIRLGDERGGEDRGLKDKGVCGFPSTPSDVTPQGADDAASLTPSDRARRLALDPTRPQVRTCSSCGLPGCMFRDFPDYSSRCKSCGPVPPKPVEQNAGRPSFEFSSDYIPPEKRSGRRARAKSGKVRGAVR